MSFLNEVRERAFSVDLTTSSEQKNLTRAYILPYINHFMTDIEGLRKVFDKHFLLNHQKSASTKMYGLKSIDKYPIGYCEDIRNGLFSFLEQHPLIVNAKKQGVIFKKAYIILNNSYFHNGIQLGNLWVDVAYDTINPKEVRVYYKPIDLLDYQNLSDYDSYCTVIEKYLNIRVFPNTIFPNIAPRFPIFVLDTEGGCSLLNHQEIILYKDITQAFALSDAFFQGAFSTRQLPQVYQDMILKQMQQAYQEQYDLRKLLATANDNQANSYQKGLSAEFFENAIKYDTLNFFFQFQMSRFCPPKAIVNQLQQQGMIPMASLLA